MLKRKAIVRRSTEKAQGLMLSISAETLTSGNNHLPPFDKFQRVVAPIFPNLKKKTSPMKKIPAIIRIKSFLFTPLETRGENNFIVIV